MSQILFRIYLCDLIVVFYASLKLLIHTEALVVHW